MPAFSVVGTGMRLVEQVGSRGLAVIFGTFSIKLSWEDVGVELFVITFQLVSVNKHLKNAKKKKQKKQQLLETFNDRWCVLVGI